MHNSFSVVFISLHFLEKQSPQFAFTVRSFCVTIFQSLSIPIKINIITVVQSLMFCSALIWRSTGSLIYIHYRLWIKIRTFSFFRASSAAPPLSQGLMIQRWFITVDHQMLELSPGYSDLMFYVRNAWKLYQS